MSGEWRDKILSSWNLSIVALFLMELLWLFCGYLSFDWKHWIYAFDNACEKDLETVRINKYRSKE